MTLAIGVCCGASAGVRAEIGPGIGPPRVGRRRREVTLGLQDVDQRGEVLAPERRVA